MLFYSRSSFKVVFTLFILSLAGVEVLLEDMNKSSELVVKISSSERAPPPSYTRYDHRRMSNEDLLNIPTDRNWETFVDISPTIVNASGLMVISNGYHKSGQQQSPSTIHMGGKADIVHTLINRKKSLSISCDSGPEALHSYCSTDLSPNTIRSLLPAIAEASFESEDTEIPISTAKLVQQTSVECSINTNKKARLMSNVLTVSRTIQGNTTKPDDFKELTTLKEDIKIKNNSSIVIIQGRSHENDNDRTINNGISVVDSKNSCDSDIQMKCDVPLKCDSVRDSQTKEIKNQSHFLDRKQSHTAMTCILHINNSTTKEPTTSDITVDTEIHFKSNNDHCESNFQQVNRETVDMLTDLSSNKIVNESGVSLKDKELELYVTPVVEICVRNSDRAENNLKEKLQCLSTKQLPQDKKLVKENFLPQPIQNYIDIPSQDRRGRDIINVDDKITLSDVIRSSPSITVHTTTKPEQHHCNKIQKSTTDLVSSTESKNSNDEIISNKNGKSAQPCNVNYDKCKTNERRSTGLHPSLDIFNSKQTSSLVISNNQMSNDQRENNVIVPTSNDEIIVIETSVATLMANNTEIDNFPSNIQVMSDFKDSVMVSNDLNLKTHSIRSHSMPVFETVPDMEEFHTHLNQIPPTLIESLNTSSKDQEQIIHPISNCDSMGNTSDIDKDQTSLHGLLHGTKNYKKQISTENIRSTTNILFDNNTDLVINDNPCQTDEKNNSKSKDVGDSNAHKEADGFPIIGTCNANAKSHSLIEKCVLKLNLKPFFNKRNKANRHEEMLSNAKNVSNSEEKNSTSTSAVHESENGNKLAAEDSVYTLKEVPDSTIAVVNLCGKLEASEMFNKLESLTFQIDEEGSKRFSDTNDTAVQQEQLGCKSKPTTDIVPEDHISEEERQATFLQFSPILKVDP